MAPVAAAPAAARPPLKVVRHLSFAGATPCPPPARAQVAKPQVAQPQVAQPASAAAGFEGDASPINVVLRLRPLSEAERATGTDVAVSNDARKRGVIHIRPANPALQSAAVRRAGHATFKFSTVLDGAATQQELFATTTLPLVTRLFDGQSSVVLAYGQTGSGKTWTIQGDRTQPGVLPRALHHILSAIDQARGKQSRRSDSVSKEVRAVTGCTADTDCGEDAQEGLVDIADATEVGVKIDKDAEYEVTASFLEVYNEQCYDLFVLPPKPRKSDPRGRKSESVAKPAESEQVGEGDAENIVECDNPFETVVPPPVVEPDARTLRRARPVRRKPLKLKEMRGGDIRAEGLREICVHSLADARTLLAFGQENRSVARTNANERSSRSHAIFSITLTTTTKKADGKTYVSRARLAFLDLAGSERTSRTNNSGKRLQEAAQINKSLMNLGRCLQDLRHNQRVVANGEPNKKRLVPFRQSRLTRLLQPSLERGSAVIIVTCSPALEDADETIHTLRRAAVAQEITIAAPARNAPVLKEITAGSGAAGNVKRKRTPRGAALRGRIGKENIAAAEGMRKRMTVEALARQLAETRHQLALERMEKEEEMIARVRAEEEAEACREEADVCRDAMEQLEDVVEKLTGRIRNYETRIAKMDADIREEVIRETEELIAEIEQNHEKELEALRADNRSVQRRCSRITKTARKKMAQRVAGRASMAVASIAYDMFSEDDEEEEEVVEGEEEDREEEEESDFEDVEEGEEDNESPSDPQSTPDNEEQESDPQSQTVAEHSSEDESPENNDS